MTAAMRTGESVQMNDAAVAADEIHFDVHGAVGMIRLDRPKALNALTLGMIRAMAARLTEWAADPAISAVLVTGAGDRAFCAGGDLRSLFAARAADPGLFPRFFREEYTLNAQIQAFPKPYVALIDGITMGGGVGISAHGSHRVATDRTLFAMPETGIGMFPDVGGGYVLPRLPGQIGMYLALTGARLKAADCVYTGLATHHIPHDRTAALVAELSTLDPAEDAAAAVNHVLDAHHVNPGSAPLSSRRALIDRCFAFDTAEAIMAALERERDPLAAEILAELARKSPTALAVTVRQIRLGAHLVFREVMAMEYRMARRMMAGHDFFEGVRALLVDKDQRPVWRPARLEEVSIADVDAVFAPLGDDELVLPPRR